MTSKNTYTCSSCGKQHTEWPALAFIAPTAYAVLPESVQKKIGELTSDFCILRHPEQTDRFIRATLTIEVIDHCENLEYGIWVSLSEKSYEDYEKNFGNPDHQNQYFGWISNDFDDYEIASIPTTVRTRLNKHRPEIIPHIDFDHQLVRDYYEGITKAEAEERIRIMVEGVSQNDILAEPPKSWWKFWK